MAKSSGYALVPTLYTMPDPFHKILRWKVPVEVRYGLYRRKGMRDGLLSRFVELAARFYGQADYGRTTPEVWHPNS